MQTSGHANDSHFVSHLMGEESIIHILPTTHIRVINDNQFLFVEEQVDEVIETLLMCHGNLPWNEIVFSIFTIEMVVRRVNNNGGVRDL